ncbi:MAG: heavy metal translocating P-type ATPase [Clostridia bacterium]|nr:heavy metal translocating P-type ATPase [Clostridia bacterium]
MTKKQRKSLTFILISAFIYAVLQFINFDSFGHFGYLIEAACYFVPYIICGAGLLRKAALNIFSGRIFDENFLMAVATIGAFALSLISTHGDHGHAHSSAGEAAIVVILYRVGTFFESIATERSRRSIAELVDILPEYANVLRDGEMLTVDPDEVEVGETIIVKSGEKIPLDGKIIKGTSSLNTSALTGESHPLNVTVGDRVISGSINNEGVLEIEVEAEYSESTVGKIVELIEEASEKKAKRESFITRFAAVYTPVVVGAAVILALLPPLLGADGGFIEWIERSLSFLVSACPCALVISVPLAFFGGMGAASKRGILIKGAGYLEALSKTKVLIFDKTGTLTKGSFRVTAIHPEKITEAELLRIAATAESYSDHPISNSLIAAYGKTPDTKAENIMELPGAGLRADIDGKQVLVGNDRLMKLEKIDIHECAECHAHSLSGSTVHIAMDGEYMGHIVISDEIKNGADETVADLKAFGIRTVMMSGDNQKTAERVANELSIDECYSNLLPDGKVKLTESFLHKKQGDEVVCFVGDGINDAPVLMRADIGISMGAMGSDAAIEAADIVIMDDNISKITLARKIAKRTLGIVTQNIIFFILVKAVVLTLSTLGYAPMWLAIFADVGVTIIEILNSTRAMKHKNI